MLDFIKNVVTSICKNLYAYFSETVFRETIKKPWALIFSLAYINLDHEKYFDSNRQKRIMLFTKKAVSFIVVSISLVVANAMNPLQALQRNAEYEKQGYRILTNANIHDYTVRVKNTPKSCEEGVQVKCTHCLT